MFNRFSLFVAACLLMFALDPLSAAAGSDLSAWSTTDLTGAIELSAIDEGGPMWTLSFRNKSTEIITAVAVAFKSSAHYYQDWLNAEPSGLAPGQTFDLTVSPDEGANRKVEISAVLFDDGGGKGDQTHLDVMHRHRFGQILESTRIKEILRSRRSSIDDASVNSLLQKLGKLPLSAEDAFISLAGISVPGIQLDSLRQSDEKMRDAVLWGISTARERALHQIEAVKQLPIRSADEGTAPRSTFLSVLQDQYETQNRRALSLLSRMQGGR